MIFALLLVAAILFLGRGTYELFLLFLFLAVIAIII